MSEQAVLRKELFADGVAGNDNTVFGYQERFAEYRYKPSLVTGKFRSSAAGSLDFWHLAQDFAAPPLLNAFYIEDRPPVARIVAVSTEPQFYLDVWMKLICARPMPVRAIPGLSDHF